MSEQNNFQGLPVVKAWHPEGKKIVILTLFSTADDYPTSVLENFKSFARTLDSEPFYSYVPLPNKKPQFPLLP